jgi:uncharacterized protein (DUF2147 family)
MVPFRVIVAAAMFTVVFPHGVQAAAWDILGVWLNAEQDARIEITMCGELYCGRIIWLKEPNYPAGATDGTPGTPKVDHNNPDPAHRKDSLVGLEIVKAFRFAGDNRWVDGTVYDPKNGKTYQGKMTLLSGHRLDLRGFIGISLLGRTTTWTR